MIQPTNSEDAARKSRRNQVVYVVGVGLILLALFVVGRMLTL